jgi:hypothetical protein
MGRKAKPDGAFYYPKQWQWSAQKNETCSLRRDRIGHRESGPAETWNLTFAKRISGFKDFDVKMGIFEQNPSSELDCMTKDWRGK